MGFTLSCKKNSTSSVVRPGTASGYLGLSLNKTCQDGSGSISFYRKGGSTTSSVSSSDFQVGEVVRIKGRINGNATSSCPSHISFECDALVSIDNERGFVCNQGGTVTFGALNAPQTGLPGLVTNTPTPAAAPYSSNIVSGEAFVYSNGKKAFVSLKYLNPDVVNQGTRFTCSAGFECDIR